MGCLRSKEAELNLGINNNKSLETNNNTDCLAIRGRGEVGALKVWENKDCEENNNYVCEYLW